MRLSAGRIRSINRAISRVQSSAWSAPVRTPHRASANPPLAASASAADKYDWDKVLPQYESALGL